MFSCIVYSMLLTLIRNNIEAVIPFNASASELPEVVNIKLFIHNILKEDPLVSLVISTEPMSLQMEAVFREIFSRHQITIFYPDAIPQPLSVLTAYPNVYIIFIDNYQTLYQLESVVTSLKHQKRSWNPAARFLLFASPKSNSKITHLVIRTFNYLWQRNIFKVWILLDKKLLLYGVSVITSSPFSKLYKTCRTITSPRQLQVLDFRNNSFKMNEFNELSFVNPKSFYGCLLAAHTVDNPIPPYTVTGENRHIMIYKSGIEIELLKLFAELYNVSITIITRRITDNDAYLYFLTNGTLTGLLEDLINNKIELVFGGLKPPGNNHFQIDITLTYGFTSMDWFVPDGDKYSYFSIIYNFLSGPTWLVVLIVCVLFSSIYYVMGSLEERSDMFCSLLGALLGTYFIKPPQTMHLRIMLVSWYLFCMHVTIMFSTNLYSMLTHPSYEHGIQTVHQVYKNQFNMCIPESWKYKYINRDTEMAEIFKRGMVCNDLENALGRLIEKRNFGIIAKADHMKSLVDVKVARIHKLDVLFPYPIGMTLSKGSVFREHLNLVIVYSMQFGLVKKWIDDVRLESKVKFSFNKTSQSHEEKGLGMEELSWIFVTLLIGYLTACLVLLVEILTSNR